MCGIAGIFSQDPLGDGDREVVQNMNNALQHRGPDDEGIYVGKNCMLGHRRLSIIDLSQDGHQPFISEDNRFVLIFNGEIYNYIELREDLEKEGITFRTKSDTEVLLKAYQFWGSDCLDKLNGMFAFVVYNTQEKSLFLARDRMGIKPLYYVIYNNRLFFASEIKAFKTIPQLKATVRHQSIFDFLIFNRTDIFDETFFNEVRSLPKGHYASYDRKGFRSGQWWNPAVYNRNYHIRDNRKAFNHLEELFCSAVRLRMRSDVTVGSCLSGGLDSSMIIGALSKQGLLDKRFMTFTSSFPGDKIDETRYVDALNKAYPFRNNRTFPNADYAMEQLQEFVNVIDHPCSDSSFYSQYEVMRLAKEQGVTVLLDGQGGDESFAGYQYFHGFYLYSLLRRKKLRNFLKELVFVILRRQHVSAFQTMFFQTLAAPSRVKLLKAASPLVKGGFFDRYIHSSKIFNEFFNARSLNESLIRHFQYKLEHLLRVEDRVSMAFSLEARLPYLDHRLVEFVLGLSEDIKINKGETKFLQKQALGQYTIQEILKRKDKIGFATPMQEWMNTPKWNKLSHENYSYLCREFPDVFVPQKKLSKNGQLRWKINQLATWRQQHTK